MQGVNSPENPGFLARAAAWWREHTGSDELSELPSGELQRMAHDLSLSEDDLKTLAASSAGQAELMARMMAARGLDIDKVRAQDPDLIRDMAVLCARCDEKRRCARDLRDGVAASAGEEYCLNVGAFKLLES
ncbi:hypothetical protein SLNSH_16875 [Alsobacter soli]|uniref:DUF6455 domain-containing protein n=1 Tax=Alsobacter soli TaxID=2109933 RepID=A0A2T1HQ71_9HYPH|nr:DUF6455 family protein [Alsobacter soli]PSC03786.1 hypothetical protein SLNSH_16875 [Alsobacter soli]